MSGLTVSVVIPTHNRAPSLARALAAVATANVSVRADVVVVDDGSSDDTEQVIDAAGVRRIRTGHVGPAAARNTGWRACSTDVVAFLDDDCVPEPGWLVSLLQPLGEYRDVVGVGGRIVPLAHGFVEDFAHAERLADHGRDADGNVRYLVTANAAFRRSALIDAGGFDETFQQPAGEDVDLSMRVAARGGRLELAADAVVAHDYRPDPASLFRTFWRHGKARTALAARHRNLDATGGRAVASPAAWSERYRRYRESVSAVRAVLYVALRVACLAVFAGGMLNGRRAGRR